MVSNSQMIVHAPASECTPISTEHTFLKQSVIEGMRWLVHILQLNSCMCPTVLKCCAIHIFPCLACQAHDFKEIDFIDVAFPQVIKLYCMRTESMAVMHLEAPDYASIKWLHKRGHIWLKEFKTDVPWLIGDKMSWKVVDEQADVAVFTAHLNVKTLDVSALPVSMG